MLLETKNIRENDIIIYTRNSMDEKYNFRIVFKNDPHIHNRIISFEHVKRLITEYFPKNLIAYRILCNFPDITMSNIKYGFVINVNDEPELIFTDPVFAVHTIEEYIQFNQNDEFRFKIQKVGYTTSNKVENNANFNEEFVFDLNIDETINQNDEIFVQPLFDKRISSRDRKKSGNDAKRNAIFKPENQNNLGFIEDSEPPKINNKVSTQEITKRIERLADGEMTYNGNKLILGKIERLQADKKHIELPFLNGRRISLEDYQTIDSSRNLQQKQKRPLKEEKSISTDNADELKLKFSDSDTNKKEEFKKVQSSTSATVHRVEINDNDSQSQVNMKDTNNQKDDLFSSFLNNLQSESSSKVIKKEKRQRESDIIQMFKSVKTDKSNMDGDQNNSDIKYGKNSKLK